MESKCNRINYSTKVEREISRWISFNASDVKWCFDRLQYFTSGIWIDGDFQKNVTPIESHELFFKDSIPILNRTEILGEYQIRFFTNFPYVSLDAFLAENTCAIHLPDPNYEYGEKFFHSIEIDDPLIGTGPFILTECIIDEQINLEFNPDYHREWSTNHIERMIYRIIPDSFYDYACQALLHHEIHFLRPRDMV